MYSPRHSWSGFTTKSKALRFRVTFQLDVQLSVGVFHTVMKGLLGKGGPFTWLQAYGNAVKKRATTENRCMIMMLDAPFCHASPTVTCHMLITLPGSLFVQLAVGLDFEPLFGTSLEISSLHNLHMESSMEETSKGIWGRHFVYDLLGMPVHRDVPVHGSAQCLPSSFTSKMAEMSMG